MKVFLPDYWIPEIKYITKNCFIFMVSGESISNKSSKNNIYYVRNMTLIF